MRNPVGEWPLLRQLQGSDSLARGAAVKSRRTANLGNRAADADEVVKSVCPYCAVGCAQNVYVKDGKVVQIEGDPDSPVSRGRLCPKGSATLQLTTGDAREHQVLYRRPYSGEWETLDLDTALEMVAQKVVDTRRETWEWESEGKRVRRTLGIASLGGATLDNEENYLIKKLWTALGVVQVENQARVCHSSTVVGLGTSFGRGGATTFPGDLQNSDCIVIEGSNMAEAHPVAFQWVMEAKARGATVIHVDPHFSRTSALADIFVPLRAGTDIAFLGGIINYVLEHDRWFRDYVVNYTNASTIIEEDFRDTEDLDGVFSGFDATSGHYDYESWQYEGAPVAAASGNRDRFDETQGQAMRESSHGETAGSGGQSVQGEPRRDETLEDPRCVFQILKRHYSRYTPEMVSQTCGVPQEVFQQVCEKICESSDRDHTSAFVYAVGWTQHTVGSQYIRTACILQLLLGNIGRPGGGIMAMRGHASIQGSSDIPTLFDLLPGYLPMPHAHEYEGLEGYVKADSADKGFWGNMSSYVVSLLKAYWGETATAANEYCFDYLPRITGAHGTYDTVMAQLAGKCKGYFLMGQNPAVGSANNRMQRMAMSKLDWLVVRDFSLIESATWWKDGPEIETGEMRSEDIATEVFFFPAAAHIEKDGTFTNTQRLLQWHHKAQEPGGEARSDLWFMFHLGRLIRERLAGSEDEMDRPILDLAWDYPTSGPLQEPSADAVLREINGTGPEGALSSYEELRDDGSTSCGCWIYCGVYAEGVNQSARRKPREQQNWTGGEWGWAWPANRRVLYNRASADPNGKPWSPRKALVWWDAEKGRWVGHDTPDFQAEKSPDYVPEKDAKGPDAITGTDPFIMQGDGRGWLYAPAGLADGPLPTHYEPQDSPFENALYKQRSNPSRVTYPHPNNRYHPSGDEPGAEVFPFVVTTYRLTEHFTAGGMTRWSPYLSELQPEFFCEVSPELAGERELEHGGWATIATARGVIEARVLVTDRMSPLTVHGRTVHQIGMPFH
ncbi:MAG: formate dehydrogenase, partial [Solirubrobacteraceae bacterium]